MIELNDDRIYVGQIKQILHSFELPMFGVYKDGFKYAAGEHYIKGDKVFTSLGKGQETEVKRYILGEHIENMTKRMPISSGLYDSKTHRYLGDYLRFLRDYIGMDLMQMYNCCGYDSPRDLDAVCPINVGDEVVSIPFSSCDSEYTLIMVPVRWGNEYTIAMDFHGSIEMACMHFEDNTMLDYDNTYGHRMLNGTYAKMRWARFNHPFVYSNLASSNPDVNMRLGEGDAKESTLKLFIKVPSSCTSSIVVLEGNYVDCSNENMLMDGYSQRLGKSPLVQGIDPNTGERATYSLMMRPTYASKSQLLSLNLGQKSLLADRIVEYLSQQAIAPNDDVVDNIKRLQRTLKNNQAIGDYSIKEYGIWDDSMRKAICKYSWLTGEINNHQDMLSYFDKDVETRIGGLLTKYGEPTAKGKVFSDEGTGGR